MRLLKLAVVNTIIGLAIALLLSWLVSGTREHLLVFEIETSLVHSTIYGLSCGLVAPPLVQRVGSKSIPWNWILGFICLGLVALLSTFAVQLSLFVLGLANIVAFGAEFFYKTATVSVVAIVIGLSIYMYESVRTQIENKKLELRTRELEKERTVKLLAEARLASLESRLHPHFLFNTLNSISALILEDPNVADEMVQRLARLLRASLDACEQERVTLEQELELAIDYLTIEQARFRERLSYSVEVPAELKSLEVPPIILQPLVENSVKHAIAPRPSGGSIRISAQRVNNHLTLEVWDDGPGFDVSMLRRGHGLHNLQARLKVILGDDSRLHVRAANGGTIVGMRLPIIHSERQ
jgi:two-component system, LytTR family, sensor histidine kinase AlgZ